MILGISGKIGVGKDTVGKIIKYHVYNKQRIESGFNPINSFNQFDDGFPRETNWEIKKFADALKEIVCILTGCTREQLESQEFKNSFLFNGWILDAEKHKEFMEKNGKKGMGAMFSYRYILQQLGTDLLRDQLHPDVWVNALMSKYKPTSISYSLKRKRGGQTHFGEAPNWIVTDVRFENEARAIKERGGINIRLNSYPSYKDRTSFEHISETALDNYSFDEIIDNNGTIEELIVKVKEILIKHKII
jgi:hypothetical protein